MTQMQTCAAANLAVNPSSPSPSKCEQQPPPSHPRPRESAAAAGICGDAREAPACELPNASINSYLENAVKPDRGDFNMRKLFIACWCAVAVLASLPSVAAAQPREPATFTIFMQVKTTPAWLALSPQRRFAFLGETIEPILARHPSVRMRFFDTEFYAADVTDVIVWETKDLAAYQAIVEALRETPFWGQYFEVVSIVPGVENAYADAYDRPAVGRR